MTALREISAPSVCSPYKDLAYKHKIIPAPSTKEMKKRKETTITRFFETDTNHGQVYKSCTDDDRVNSNNIYCYPANNNNTEKSILTTRTIIYTYSCGHNKSLTLQYTPIFRLNTNQSSSSQTKFRSTSFSLTRMEPAIPTFFGGKVLITWGLLGEGE